MAEETTSTPLLSWHTKEYEEKERGRDWHWYVGLIAVLAAVIAFFVHNIFFGIFLLVAGTVVIIYAKRKPEDMQIEIGVDGISINGDNIPFKHIKQFWLDETENQDKLLLLVQTSFVPLLAFTLEGVTATEVRAALDGKIPEIEMREPTSVKIFDRLGF
jgi:hypothetical protein